MGHAGDTTVPTASNQVYQDFASHFSGVSSNTKATTLASIKRIHSDKHVTVIQRQICDLLNYANAGHAKAELVTVDEEYWKGRSYRAPASRLDGGDGILGERVNFGHYVYHFQDTEFPIYMVSWYEPQVGQKSYTYILSTKDDVDANGHSASADHLVKLVSKWTSQLHEEVYVFDSGRWQKNRQLWSAVQSSSWDDVLLDPSFKETLINDVSGFFDSRSIYEEYSVPWKRGIIFHGTPGCGKTMSIKALMNTLQVKDVVSLYVKSFDASQGMQHSIRLIFTQARVMAPCLLIFEDLDSLVVDAVRSYFLNEVDGLEDNNGILMIGSTNHLERLDPGISKRPSRFDRKYHFRLPGHDERVAYCKYWKEKLEKNSMIDFDPEICEIVTKLTEGFSFAYMKELFVQTVLTIVGGRTESADDEVDEDAAEEIADGLVIVEDSSKLAKEGETTESSTADDKTPPPHPRQVPEVDIPECLQSNPFLQTLRKQITALVKDMDNTKDEALPKVP